MGSRWKQSKQHDVAKQTETSTAEYVDRAFHFKKEKCRPKKRLDPNLSTERKKTSAFKPVLAA